MSYPCTLAKCAAAKSSLSLILRRIPTPHAARMSTSTAESVLKSKRSLRSKVRKALKEMDPIQRSGEDEAIQSIVLNAPWFKSSRALCAYISCSSLREVDTSRILSESWGTPAKDDSTRVAKRLYVPRVEDKSSHMRMLHISSMDDLIANSMDILEPAPVDASGQEREDVLQANDPVDLLLLPGLAFDRSGRRLGRGGGNWKQPLLVALSYSVQTMDEEVIPVTPTDVPIDALVHPGGVIPISNAATESLS
ncbi:hypothetical protein MLD38_027954 [Melastoma candidum]|uniref:Uncharacterized protein n=1 Tax=Melastoma candidum TaxID=119954 RepID=A0ACB9N0X2_9MYRT|nr:hypothetical protein MLD38_027954 [Melastoma candidum]